MLVVLRKRGNSRRVNGSFKGRRRFVNGNRAIGAIKDFFYHASESFDWTGGGAGSRLKVFIHNNSRPAMIVESIS